MTEHTNHYYYSFEQEGNFSYSAEDIDQLSEYEKYQLSFHPERPKYLDYLSLFDSVEECFSSDEFGAWLIQTHRAEITINGSSIPLMLIGQQTGPTSRYNEMLEMMKDGEKVKHWNHGMPTPASYERAIRAVDAANEESRMIITFVDTPGADPTEESEAGGIAWRIGETIQKLIESNTPTLSLIINRGCSGGAIALTGCDCVLAMEYSTYLVITPEACSSILFHTRHRANEAAEVSQITSREGFELGIVDEMVPEKPGPAHRNPAEAIQAAGTVLKNWIRKLNKIPAKELFQDRIKRWKKIGHWDEVTVNKTRLIQEKVSRLPIINKEGFVQRHKDCYSKSGKRVYDPVNGSLLQKNNYVCDICGHKYVRPSAWDYMDLILDQGSFNEHEETRYIKDKDILEFPGYSEKLEETRLRTGMTSALITGMGKILENEVIYCGTEFGFLGGSYCMSSGEKIWRAAEIALTKGLPMVLQACGGGARMHEGCSSMVGIPKAHVALTRVEHKGIPVITLITDPTLGGVAIGYGSRGIRLFELNSGNIGFSGRRVIEQYVGHKLGRDFQTTQWLHQHGHADIIVTPENIRQKIVEIIEGSSPQNIVDE